LHGALWMRIIKKKYRKLVIKILTDAASYS
jgi:hypothetical protein